ncbi:glycosyl hydrolase family 18 protein [Mucilaginibacter roseus]|uniref:Glycosyl hydrolase family 18 protein n=1 Tax=Mucilaginibacter roseus TaxID=1528868 RepID=A0ABS8U830_9SPHI|nr:endo-beta-N-acetylglucosaminidase H [Mucilaginibacter roseus]MCD8742097.1 glycosyl hydrolase family 18 protein [Mucilaginibacter roseus]
MKTNLVFKNAVVMTAGALMLSISACKKDAAPVVDVNKQAPVKRSDALGASGPKSVCYVEVNYNDIRNVGNYKLTTGEQLFDIGIIFAANINYNTSTQTAQLYFNQQVTNVLTNRNTYIQPLQDRGIKVLLSILGNHQGAGICNFPNQAAAQAFAQQLANAVNTYNLDGIDFDDEYANYGANGTGQPNSSSFVYLVTALRQLLPNKIISFYYYGPAASRLSYNGVTVGSKINYSWNAIYGTYSVPTVPGLSAANLGPAAIDIQATSSATAASLATQTVNNGYGIYLTYNLPNTDVHTYLSSFSNVLYGKATVYDTSLGTGVRFFADANYGGYGTGIIPKGTYTLTQLEKFGFVNDWASSIKIPSGWTVTMYADNNSTGQSWTLTSNNSNFTTLSPNANDVITSVKIQ